MKNKLLLSFFTVFMAAGSLHAQTATSSSTSFHPAKTTLVPFSVEDKGKQLPINWGLDTAWPHEENMRRGIAFIGPENLATARASFQPSDQIVNGELSNAQKAALNNRLNLIQLGGVKNIMLNCDHEALNTPENATAAQQQEYAQHRANYVGKPEEWVKLIEATARYCINRGFTVVAVAPFNEPDYGWNQGSRTDFYNIVKLLKENSFFDNIRICGANTLNSNQALPWYNTLKQYLDEGNTHQLAGDFNDYASFFQTVRADGKHATADELHNVMEAMVGVEYGMQTGIWWAFDGLARGEFCRASVNGERLAYAENRPTWTAASVYRNNQDNKVQAFLGTSERQANNASYHFVSKDRDVFYDGYGPVRGFTVDMPGGTGYQVGQTNAERVVNITWGEDVQPYINGNYVIQNQLLGNRVLSLSNATAEAGSQIVQRKHSQNATYQQWSVTPVDSRIGGDFSYYTIRSVHNSDFSLDVLNRSLDEGANIIAFNDNKGAQQQWYLQYVGNGYFYIRSRQSALCLQASKVGEGIAITQGKPTGAKGQLWRFFPAGLSSEFEAPAAPQNVMASSLPAAIRLEWEAVTTKDLAGYTILRAEVPQEAGTEPQFNTIARGITENLYHDNAVRQGVNYLYKVKAQDKVGNISTASESVQASTNGERALIAQLQFEDTLADNTLNRMDGTFNGELKYTNLMPKSGEKNLYLSGSDHFVQLPHEIAGMDEMTICTWVRWQKESSWQRIFDFGNGTDQYMFLTPSNGSEMRFVLKNGGNEEILSATKLRTLSWNHLAVSIGNDAVVLYLNGEEAARSTTMSIRPSDIRPVMNYIGRSQFSADPLFSGYIDDFRIYNYALSADEIKEVTEDLANNIEEHIDAEELIVTSEYYTPNGTRILSPTKGVNIIRHIYSNGNVRIEKKVF